MFKIFLFISLLTIPSVAAGLENPVQARFEQAKAGFEECKRELPSKAELKLQGVKTISTRNWSSRLRKKFRECSERKVKMEDYASALKLSQDLQNLFSGSLSDKAKREVKSEADELSLILVEATEWLNRKYKMAGSALWHNFLIKVGAKKGGYCYQWAQALFDSLPKKKYVYFERHWGVHNKKRVTENNAVILTERGAPVESGYVYDPWRGRGRPFWRRVSDDSQDWNERYAEDMIICCSPL